MADRADRRKDIVLDRRQRWLHTLDVEFHNEVTAFSAISGWQVAEQVKRIAPNMPVIMVTGWGAQIDAEKIHNSGVDRVMTKPFQWLDVLETLRDTVGRSQTKTASTL